MKNFTLLKCSFYAFLISLLLCWNSVKTEAQINVTYSFTQSSELYSPISGGNVLATATTVSGATAIDDVVFPVSASAWPFPFQFNFLPVSQIYVSSNGFITFGTVSPPTGGTSTGYTPISNGTGAASQYDGCASAFGRNMIGVFVSAGSPSNGELRYETIGSSPSRKFVIQYKNFKPNGTASVMNFQIRLCETTNNIEVVYGSFTSNNASTAQVGLRGGNNTIFLNRSVVAGTNTWSNSIAGTLNTSSCAFNNTGLIPPSGLVFRFGPPPCPAPINLAATNVTQTTADLTWSVIGGGGTFNMEYGLNGFTPGTGTVINNIAGTSVSISGLTAQTNYQFYVTQNCSSSGNGFSAVSGPKNFSSGGPGEDCTSAPVIAVAPNSGGAFTVITSGVSQNGPLATCSDAFGNIPNDDRWIKFTAPSNGSKLIILTSAGTINDWVMELWNGCPGSGGTLLMCADDDSTFMPLITLCQDQYTPSQVYYLRMWTYGTSTGTMNLKIYETAECPIPPPNDVCTFATRLNITPPNSCPASAVTLTTKYATVSGDVSSCGTASTIKDVWMVFNTGNFGDFNLSFALGTATSLKAAIFFECNGAELMCFNAAAGTHLITGLNPGADYIIRVWSDSTGWGTFTTCLADVCQEPAASISGSTIICQGDTAHISVTFTGGGPWTLTYNDGTNNHVVTTSTSPYVLDSAPPATTFYSLVSVSNPICSGTVSGNYLVNVIPKPQINNITPSSGATGTVVAINGNNFSNISLVGINNVNTSSFTIINNGQINFPIPSGSTSGLISVKNMGCTVYSSSIFTVLSPNVTVSLKVLIEGFYQGGGMLAATLDPVNKPNVCDSVELSLYNMTAPYQFVIKRGAELSTNGNVSFVFPSSIAGNSYYLAVKHRNALETWSKNPVFIPSSGIFFNFSQ